jgi:hypothetical protein
LPKCGEAGGETKSDSFCASLDSRNLRRGFPEEDFDEERLGEGGHIKAPRSKQLQKLPAVLSRFNIARNNGKIG